MSGVLNMLSCRVLSALQNLVKLLLETVVLSDRILISPFSPQIVTFQLPKAVA